MSELVTKMVDTALYPWRVVGRLSQDPQGELESIGRGSRSADIIRHDLGYVDSCRNIGHICYDVGDVA